MPVDPQIEAMLAFLRGIGAPPAYEGTPEEAARPSAPLSRRAEPRNYPCPIWWIIHAFGSQYSPVSLSRSPRTVVSPSGNT
ncbi:MAG TPA: hypothetical protein VGG75_04775 [Trebonia sp.]